MNYCACGCDTAISPTATWAQGHDSVALSFVLRHRYGGGRRRIENLIRAHGYGDGPGMTPIPRDFDRREEQLG